MAMQQCPNGHLFDDAKNNSCPFCNEGNSLSVTVPLSDPQVAESSFPQTAPLDGYIAPNPQINNAVQGGSIPPTTPLETSFGPTMYVDGAVNEKGILEVRGWLVCLEGEKRGEDFKIRGEKNTIGRGSENDIKLDFDNSISKGVNATISYDNRNNIFFIIPGESKNNIYINNNMLMTPVELKDYDVIEFGNTKMIFRSLCNEAFNWSKEKKAEDAE